MYVQGCVLYLHCEVTFSIHLAKVTNILLPFPPTTLPPSKAPLPSHHTPTLKSTSLHPHRSMFCSQSEKK